MCNEDRIGAVLGHVSGGAILTLVGGEALELLPALKVTNYLKAVTTATSDALLATKSGSKALNVTKNFLKTPEYTRKAGTNLIDQISNKAFNTPNWISGLEAYGYSKISPKERFKDNVYTKLNGGK